MVDEEVDEIALLTQAARVLEERSRKQNFRFEHPESFDIALTEKIQRVATAILNGDLVSIHDVGGFIYYLADSLDDADNYED